MQAPGVGLRRVDLGVAGVRDAGGVQGLLMHRTGRDRIDLPGQGRLDGRLNVVVGGPTRVGAHDAWVDLLGGDCAEVEDRRLSDLVPATGPVPRRQDAPRLGPSQVPGDAGQDRRVAKDDGDAAVQLAGALEQLDADLRPDPGRVAHRDRDPTRRHGESLRERTMASSRDPISPSRCLRTSTTSPGTVGSPTRRIRRAARKESPYYYRAAEGVFQWRHIGDPPGSRFLSRKRFSSIQCRHTVAGVSLGQWSPRLDATKRLVRIRSGTTKKTWVPCVKFRVKWVLPHSR